MLEMKIVLRAALSRFTLSPAGSGRERARRRGITISPGRGGEVILRPTGRDEASAPAPAGAAAPVAA